MFAKQVGRKWRKRSNRLLSANFITMDRFLFYGDFKKLIQADNLTQITGSDDNVLNDVITNAVEECASNLRGKFDVSQALRPISVHDKTKTYLAGQTVYLDAPAYDKTKTYILGALTLQSGLVYKNSTAITTPEDFNVTKWTLIGAQYTVYNAIYPKSQFNYKTIYNIGDQVFWLDKTYIAKIKTEVLSHDGSIQIGYISDTVLNSFPDQSIKQWGVGTYYSIPVNTEITNTTYWSQGDNRDAKLLQVCTDIALYHLHARISSRNIPDLRIQRYMGNAEDRETRGQRVLYPTYCALGWLQAANIGSDITPNLPLVQPDRDSRIQFGGRTKQENSY